MCKNTNIRQWQKIGKELTCKKCKNKIKTIIHFLNCNEKD
jgi:hypothetical protein